MNKANKLLLVNIQINYPKKKCHATKKFLILVLIVEIDIVQGRSLSCGSQGSGPPQNFLIDFNIIIFLLLTTVYKQYDVPWKSVFPTPYFINSEQKMALHILLKV